MDFVLTIADVFLVYAFIKKKISGMELILGLVAVFIIGASTLNGPQNNSSGTGTQTGN